MKVMLNRVFMNPENMPIEKVKGVDLTLKDVIVSCLTVDFKDEQDLSGEEKHNRYHMAMKVRDAGDVVELSLQELGMVKELIGKLFGVVIVGQAWDMLEGE